MVGVVGAMGSALSGNAETATLFLPTDLPGLIAWYDIPSLDLSNNDGISTLTDYSGNDLHGSQSTAANQPTFKTHIQNGLSTAYFDGTDEFWVVGHDTLLNHASGYSVHVIASLSDGFRIAQKGDGVGADDETAWFFGRSSTLGVHCFATVDELPISSWGIFGGTWDGAALWNYWDGTLLNPTAVNFGTENPDHSMDPGEVIVNNVDDLYIGKRNDPASGQVTGYLGEIVIADMLTTDEQQHLEGYFNTRWGL